MSKTLHTTGLLKSVTVLSLATGVVLGGKYIIDMNKPSSENTIISSTTTREETYQDKKIVENNTNTSSNSKTEEKTVSKTNNSSENSIESNQQKLTKNDDSVKNDNEVETVLVNNSYSNSISSNPNNISEMTTEAQKDKEDYSNSNTSKIQSELSEPTSNVNSNNVPEAIVSKKGEALVQPELPAYTGEVSAKGTQEEGHEGESLIQPELPEFNGGVNPNEAPSVDVPEAIVSEKGEALVQPELPEYTGEITTKGTQEAGHEGESLIQPELPEFNGGVNPNEAPSVDVPEAIVSEKGEALVQPELPEYTGEITTKGTQEAGHEGESLIQPELPEFNGGVNPNEAPSVDIPEAIVSEKGEALVQPELPEYHVSEKGESLVQPELPEYTGKITTKGTQEEGHEGESLIQPELPEFNGGVNPNEAPSIDVPEAIVSEKGEALVQPELPEYHISEKGESLVQPELPEFNGGVNPNEAPSVDVPEYKIKTVKREDVTTLTPSYVRMANMKLNEGETQITHNGKNGSLTKVYEDIVGEDGKILKSTLLSENRVEPEIKVIRYGTKKSGENLGETGLYRLSEHTKDIDIVAFNQNIKLNGNEMKSLGQNELYKRSQTDIENNLFLAGKPGWYIIANAPLSEESIKKLNDGSYINHKNVGQEMLKLVNEERKRVGKKTLKWSNGLYELSKIRAKELCENGNIRYYNSNNEELKHSRDENGTKWFTVAKGSSFQERVLGENLAGYTLPRNIYKVFSEKAIAEQLFNQWKASKGHYANMIDSDYTEFGFDFALSPFWRTNHTNIDYLAQGLQGVQLFAV